MVNDNIQDVEFTEAVQETTIRGSILYYSTNQVSSIIGIPDSTVRYYTKVFEDILNIEIYNKQRKYKQGDIDKLKFIVELKNEGMSVKQINEFCSNGVSFDGENGIQVKESNPLSIQTLSKALLEEQKKQMDEFKEDMFNRIEMHFTELSLKQMANQEEIKESMIEEISTTVDDVMSDKFESLENSVNEIKESIRIAYVTNEQITKKSNGNIITKIRRLLNKDIV